MTQSDNTANDILLWKAGGPAAVRAVWRARTCATCASGRASGCCRRASPGVTWQPGYSVGNSFYAARGSLPASVRQSAFQRYLADRWTARRRGIADGLAKLKRGQLISQGIGAAAADRDVRQQDGTEPDEVGAPRPAG
jgi:beta-lactamase class A